MQLEWGNLGLLVQPTLCSSKPRSNTTNCRQNDQEQQHKLPATTGCNRLIND
jgi:hypothetical protein